MKVEKVESIEEKSIQQKEQEAIDAAKKENGVEDNDDGIVRVDLRNIEKKEDDDVSEEQGLNKDKEEDSIEESEEKTEDETKEEDKELDKIQSKELTEDDVLEFVESNYGKKVSSLNELLTKEEKESEELPSDVSAFLKYKKETGRGLDDYMKLNQDFDSMSDEMLLKQYYSSTENDLGDEDIQFLIEDNFGYDESLDDDSEIKKKRIAKKRELAKARKFFNQQKEQYKAPVESAASLVPEEEKESFNAYKEYIQNSKSLEEQNIKRSQYFEEKTNELFNEKFEGFKFDFNDKEVVYKPKDVESVKTKQSDISNFINKYLDDNGMISDPKGYHKAMFMAMNPDKVAKYFIEQGMAMAVENDSKKTKNLDLDVRSTPKKNNTGGVKVQAVSSNKTSWNSGKRGNGLKITKRKK